MPDYPETRASLIARLKDRADQDAWATFAELYQPVVYRLAAYKGLQHADAEDLTQQVMAAVAAAVHRWEPDAERGRFRAWLRRIAQNLIINMITRRAADRAGGDDETRKRLLDEAAQEDADSEFLRTEFRREVFQWAVRQIQGEFQAETWMAFWHTAVEGRDVDEVAQMLGKKTGAVYASRGRVMRRLKEQVLLWDGDE